MRARVALPSLFRERVPTPSWMLPAKTELELLDVPTLRVTGATKVLVTILVTPPLMLVMILVTPPLMLVVILVTPPLMLVVMVVL